MTIVSARRQRTTFWLVGVISTTVIFAGGCDSEREPPVDVLASSGGEDGDGDGDSGETGGVGGEGSDDEKLPPRDADPPWTRQSQSDILDPDEVYLRTVYFSEANGHSSLVHWSTPDVLLVGVDTTDYFIHPISGELLYWQSFGTPGYRRVVADVLGIYYPSNFEDNDEVVDLGCSTEGAFIAPDSGDVICTVGAEYTDTSGTTIDALTSRELLSYGYSGTLLTSDSTDITVIDEEGSETVVDLGGLPPAAGEAVWVLSQVRPRSDGFDLLQTEIEGNFRTGNARLVHITLSGVASFVGYYPPQPEPTPLSLLFIMAFDAARALYTLDELENGDEDITRLTRRVIGGEAELLRTSEDPHLSAVSTYFGAFVAIPGQR